MPIDQPPAIVQTAPTFQSWEGPAFLQIRGSGNEPMVTISMKDGSITYGPHYKPDVAAQAFWRAMSSEYQEFLTWKQTQPTIQGK